MVLFVCLHICRKNAGGSAERALILISFLMSICTLKRLLHGGFCLHLCSVYVCNLLVEAVSPIKRKTLCAQSFNFVDIPRLSKVDIPPRFELASSELC